MWKTQYKRNLSYIFAVIVNEKIKNFKNHSYNYLIKTSKDSKNYIKSINFGIYNCNFLIILAVLNDISSFIHFYAILFKYTNINANICVYLIMSSLEYSKKKKWKKNIKFISYNQRFNIIFSLIKKNYFRYSQHLYTS